MSESYAVVHTLLDCYNYGGVYDYLKSKSLTEADEAKLVLAFRRSINFDFEGALTAIYSCDKDILNDKFIQKEIRILKDLERGVPVAMFSELLENLKIQLDDHEYIDFLGRVYRFKESIYKYMLIKSVMAHKRFDLNNNFMSKTYQVKMLKRKYKIYHSNINYGVVEYFNKYKKDDQNAMKIIKLLESNKVRELMNLRHNSIVGHGFKSVSYENIAKIYGNPKQILDDFEYCLKLIDINVKKERYLRINAFLDNALKSLLEEKI